MLANGLYPRNSKLLIALRQGTYFYNWEGRGVQPLPSHGPVHFTETAPGPFLLGTHGPQNRPEADTVSEKICIHFEETEEEFKLPVV